MQWSNKAIKELFTNNMTIPEYQRSYTWNESNVDDFFTDLSKFVQSEETYYLFGQIIVHCDKSSGLINIVDGQQRITTSTIFLCAIRDIIKKRDYKSDSLLHSINGAIGFEDGEYRLTSGSENKEFLINFIQNGNHDYPPQCESDKLILDSYQLLSDNVEKWIGMDDRSLDRLKTLTKGFLDGFHVSYVETDSISQAFTVFETLNARGTPLEVPDLLKNHFFSMIDNNHEYVKDKWKEMVKKITNSGT